MSAVSALRELLSLPVADRVQAIVEDPSLLEYVADLLPAEEPGPVDVAGLRALLAGATPGPWRHGSVERYHVFVPCADCMGPERVILRMNEHFPHEADAALIVAAVNALPALLAAAEERDAAAEERDALKARVAAADEHARTCVELCSDEQVEENLRDLGLDPAEEAARGRMVVSTTLELVAERDRLRSEVQRLKNGLWERVEEAISSERSKEVDRLRASLAAAAPAIALAEAVLRASVNSIGNPERWAELDAAMHNYRAARDAGKEGA